MPELLQRATGMEVFQVRDRMKVKPNCVYVIPPNKDMSILHGVLHLFEPTAPRGLRLPIDFFLRSLAEDRQEQSIGVILSGMGSDGTMGLRAIKEKAGLVLVQEPSSAKFDSMPRSAIDAGLADLVAPAEELPGKIVGYLRHARVITRTERPLEEKDQSALEKVVILLRAKPATTSRCTRKTPSTAGSSGAWAFTRSTASRLRPLSAGESPGGGAALQGTADRRDQLFPRPGGVGAAAGRPSRRSWRAGRPVGRCGPGRPAARPARRPIRWP
jgi:hypothetical protein